MPTQYSRWTALVRPSLSQIVCLCDAPTVQVLRFREAIIQLTQNITEVFDGVVTWQTENDPLEGPRSFDDFSTTFQAPFNYEPTEGNLLLEFVAARDWSTVGGSFLLDTHISTTPNTTFVAAADPVAEVARNLIKGFVPTQFVFATRPLQAGDADQDLKFDQLDLVYVPEPTSILLIAIGLAMGVISIKGRVRPLANTIRNRRRELKATGYNTAGATTLTGSCRRLGANCPLANSKTTGK